MSVSFSFFFNDTATTEIYTLSLHDALPIWSIPPSAPPRRRRCRRTAPRSRSAVSLRLGRVRSPAPSSRTVSISSPWRSEEHTSELQSRQYLVCRLLLEKKKQMQLFTDHQRD